MEKNSLCQRLDSRQLTQIQAPEARGKSSAKRERERRRRESPPEAKGERSEPFAGGARDSAKRNMVKRSEKPCKSIPSSVWSKIFKNELAQAPLVRVR